LKKSFRRESQIGFADLALCTKSYASSDGRCSQHCRAPSIGVSFKMKKGKKISKKRAVEEEPALLPHFHRHRVIHGSLAFDFTTPSPEAKFGVSSDDPDDTRNYTILFNPPLEKSHGSSSYLTITHIESKRMDTRICILPKTEEKRLIRNWFIFVTHLVQLDEQLNACIGAQLAVTNCQLRGDVDTPIWKPVFRLDWFCDRELGSGRYIPLNPVPTDSSLPVDVSRQPQGSGTIINKGAGGISSNQAGKLIGYFMSKDGKKEAFTGWKAATVRFGKVNEPVAMLMYMNHHKDRVFSEAGYMSIGETLHGAMVDGVVSTQASTHDPIIPNGVERDLSGAVEFKCSRSNCNFEPFHISQCIWEMACGFPHVDLVRYAEIPNKQPGTNVWETLRVCKEIRIYRNQELEDELIRLCKLSHPLSKNNYAQFCELMQTEPYQKMRSYLEHMASKCNECASPIPVDLDLLKRLEKYKEHTLSIQFDDSLSVHPIMDRIEKRQARIFAAFQEVDAVEFIRETMDQMQDMGELVSAKLSEQ
jgi:hypothetical protein